MKKTINYQDFRREFEEYDRLSNFPEGLRALWDFLEQYEEDTEEEIELDVIALCCDYTEEKLETVLKEHNLDSLEELQDHTTVIMVDDETDENPTIIYQVF